MSVGVTHREEPAPPAAAPAPAAAKVFEELSARVRERTALVGIIGLGYVGLPLARAFSSRGYRVLGFDTDPNKVDKLRRGESYIGHVAASAIREMRQNRFDPTADPARLGEADVIIVCVPTPLTDAREPDLTYVEGSVRAIAATIRRGQLVVLESSTYPTTTRAVVLPILEATGLRAGADFFLAYSPEREDPGNPNFSTSTIPKVVGGLDPRSLDLAVDLYRDVVVSVVPVSSPEVAEACKILENTYRAVNIALVNELKVLYDRMGIDVWEVIDAARTKPFGFQAFYPGPGLGGHCLAGHEWVTVRDRCGVRAIRFASLFDRFAAGARAGRPGVEVSHPTGLEALSVDPHSGAASFEPVTHLFRRKSPTPLLRVIVEGNRHLTVTDGHPMLVREYDGIEERRADHLKPGDEIVLLSTWPSDSSLSAALAQVELLLCGDGDSPLLSGNLTRQRVGSRPVEVLEPLVVARPYEGLVSPREATLNETVRRSWRDHNGYATAEVVSTERTEPGSVFSMEVAGNHTFVTSFGIVVHNCIPIDPFYLTWVARQNGLNTRFIELAGEVNTAMPAFVVSKVTDALNQAGLAVKGSRIAILGMAYKKDVDDPRESPSFELMDLLLRKGGRVSYNDPHVPVLPRMRHWPHLEPLLSCALTPDYLESQDCVLIATDHSAYDYTFIVQHSRLVVDTRNATRNVKAGREKIVRA